MAILRRAGGVAAVVAGAATLAACAPAAPDRDADAVGAVVEVHGADEGAARVDFAPDPGYEYFEGTAFSIAPDELVGADLADLAAGDHIEVWVSACAESFPVQCEVVAARVLD